MSVSNQNEAQVAAPSSESEEVKRQFVTFHLGSESMAFDMDRVMEIVRLPITVEVPLTPSSLVGLANLRGSILPILSLRRVLGMEDVEATDATRVMVLNYCGKPLGFVVDKVTRVMGVASECIEPMNSARSNIDAKLLSGVIKNEDNKELIQLVDIDALTELEYAQFNASNDSVVQGNTTFSEVKQNSDEHLTVEDSDILQLVSFSVADQEYSFSIEATQEIIRLPETISTVPKAPSHVIGMVNLRNRVLPLVKLRTLFNLPELELNENNRIVVVTLPGSGGSSMVGVVVDEVREVLRIHKKQIESVPELLLDGDDSKELEGICQLDDGRRIVTLLSAEKLFQRDDVLDAVDCVNQADNLDSVQDSFVDQQSAEEGSIMDHLANDYSENEPQLVVFNLMDQEFGVMIESVREILRLPDSLTKVPKTNDFVEGMVNLRGAVLPIIDMRKRFDLPSQEQNDRQRILVLNQENVLTGYIVDSVSEVLRLQADQVEDAPCLSDEQVKMMGKIVNLRKKKRIITVLEPEQLLSTQEQQKLVEEVHESTDS